jgi:hypothetical protein
MKDIGSLIGLLFVSIAIGAIGFFSTSTYQGLKQQEINNEARYQCAMSSRYETVEKEVTVWYPVQELYEKCLDEKNIK